MPVDPAADHRPVFQHEERRKQGEGQEEDHRGEALDPARRPIEELGAAVGNGLGDVLLGARGPVRAGVVSPPLDLVERLCGGSLDLGGVLDDPAEHEQRHDDRECDQEQQDDECTASRGNPFACMAPTSGLATAATIVPATTGVTIVEISPSSQMAPNSTAPIPKRNHDWSPRSRSQVGAREHSGELAFVELVRGAFGRRFRRLRFARWRPGIFMRRPVRSAPGRAIEAESDPHEHRPKRVILPEPALSSEVGEASPRPTRCNWGMTRAVIVVFMCALDVRNGRLRRGRRHLGDGNVGRRRLLLVDGVWATRSSRRPRRSRATRAWTGSGAPSTT